MNHQHAVEILGAHIQTTRKISCDWPKDKTSKILREIQLIKAIPTCRSIHEHLVGTKIIPQLTYAAHVVDIPKNQLKLVQDGIADLLWKKRPPWRARPLVLGLLAKPHRVDPMMSRSYNTIIECVNFLKNCPDHGRFHWANQFEIESQNRIFLVTCYKQACTNLGCEIVGPFHLSFLGSPAVCILDFGTRDLKVILQILCRNTCYQEATKIARKDVRTSDGVLDFPSTCLGHRYCKSQFINGISMQAFRDSAMVGCNTTNDRRYKAGFTDNNLCRFCKTEPESFLHLTSSCVCPPFLHLKPVCPQDCGPNFLQLGIVEVPRELQHTRLQISKTSDIPVKPWTSHTTDAFLTVWTDGSCMHGDMFWQTKGAAAGVKKLGKCIFQVEVRHISLNSYACELWALIQAFCRSDQPCACRTDCASLVTQTHFMMTNLYIPSDFSHYEWWIFFLGVYKTRLCMSKTPLSISWIPSHLLEDFPAHQITAQQAIDAGASWEDIYCNRKADYFAKQCAANQCSHNTTEKQRVSKIQQWQTWIALVNSKLSEISAIDYQSKICPEIIEHESDPSDKFSQYIVPPSEPTIEHSLSCFQKVFPRWIWEPDPSQFVWKPDFIPCTLRSYATISQHNWETCIGFLNSLTWIQGSSYQTAYVELAFAAWYQDIRFCDISNNPKEYAQLIRKCINQCCKIQEQGRAIPGDQKAKCKSQGCTLPSGYLSDCWPLIPCKSLKFLALYAIKAKSQKLSDWGTPFW